jgi:hypothetical protein
VSYPIRIPCIIAPVVCTAGAYVVFSEPYEEHAIAIRFRELRKVICKRSNGVKCREMDCEIVRTALTIPTGLRSVKQHRSFPCLDVSVWEQLHTLASCQSREENTQSHNSSPHHIFQFYLFAFLPSSSFSTSCASLLVRSDQLRSASSLSTSRCTSPRYHYRYVAMYS